MTREEAIEELERLLMHWDLIDEGIYDLSEHDKDAVEIALSALHPVSRERVEKVWPGCPYCKEDGEGYVKKFGAYSILDGEVTTGHCKSQKIKFCPHCSRPLTDEAVEMVMERLEALHDTGN